MKYCRVFKSMLPVVLTAALANCGTYVPQIHEFWEPADIKDVELITRIKNSIYCELREAVHSLETQGVDPGPIGDNLIPRDYGVQMTLMMQVDETGAFNPGLTATRSLGGTDSFTFGAGGIISSQSTRVDTSYSFFTADTLKAPIGQFDSTCGIPVAPGISKPLDRTGSSYLLSGNLDILAWLRSAVRQQKIIPSDNFPSSVSKKVDVLSYHIKFMVITTGTVNPAFKFVNLSSNSAALLSGNRTRTHDLVITLGPDVETKTPSSKGQRIRTLTSPGEAAFGVHLSTQIGAAVASNLTSRGF